MRILHTRIALIVFLLVMFLTNLDLLYPSIMEARNFVSAREMLEKGDFLFTTLNGMPRYEKPPLPTWITAFFGHLFGTHNNVALRVPNAILCILTIWYLKKIVQHIFGSKSIAYNAAYVASSLFLILYVGKSNVWDVYSNCFIIISIYHFMKMVETDKTRNWFLFSLCIAASLLSKGPVGFLFLFIPFFVVYVLWINPNFFRQVNYWKAIFFGILTIALGTSWYIYIYLNDYSNFMLIFDKEASAVVNRNVKPWYRYLSFPVQSGVWAIPAIIALFMCFFNNEWKKNKYYLSIAIWMLGSVFLLSLMPEKKERYLFPVMFPLSILVALWLHRVGNFLSLNKEKRGAQLYYFLVAIVGIAITFVTVFYLEQVKFFPKFIFVLLMIGNILVLMTTTIFGKLNTSLRSTLLMLLIINVLGLPLFAKMEFNNPDYRSLNQITEKTPNLAVYSYEFYSPEVWYNFQKIIPDFNDKQIGSDLLEDQHFLMISEKPLDEISRVFSDFQIIKQSNFDENWEKPNSKNYKERKRGIVYEMKRKNSKVE